MNMVRIAGGAFVLVLLTFFFVMWRREKHRLSRNPHPQPLSRGERGEERV
jgi:hypothetical protein